MSVIDRLLGRPEPEVARASDVLETQAKRHVETLKRVEQVVRMARVDAEVEARKLQ